MRRKIVHLEFRPASDPPDTERSVLCADGEAVMVGWYDEYVRIDPGWYCSDGSPWPEVKAWAELPEPGECIPR